MPLRALGIAFALPMIGVILAWAAPAERGTAQVRRSVRTVVSLVVALARCMVVALLPYETVFFLKIFGGGFALLAVAFAGILAVALPLALRESPVPDSDAAPWSLWVTRRNVALASPGWSAWL